jgi:hypothetical protein
VERIVIAPQCAATKADKRPEGGAGMPAVDITLRWTTLACRRHAHNQHNQEEEWRRPSTLSRRAGQLHCCPVNKRINSIG